MRCMKYLTNRMKNKNLDFSILSKKLFYKIRSYTFPKKTYINEKVNVRIIKNKLKKHSFFGYYDRSPLHNQKYLFLSTNSSDYKKNQNASIDVFDIKRIVVNPFVLHQPGIFNKHLNSNG